jgi:linoleoyl-CoA desaturase
MWKIQHNVLHHSYTNIEGADDDLDPRFVMRFTPNQKRLWFHRFQHIYATLMYCFVTLMWVSVKDLNKWGEYKSKGLLPKDKNPYTLLGLIVLRKLGYFGLFLVLPMVVLPFSPWLTLGMFLLMHATAGVMLSFVFQSAHVVPGTAFIQQESNEIDENRFTHQLMTTANFARNSKLFFWLFGGLNFQIEHHMFPNICHIHYPKMSEIVEKTAQEFGIDYRINRTFGTAILGHLKLLKQLGQAA